MNFNKEELLHHGVKGQKWGVRRYQTRDGRLTEKGRTKLKGIRRKERLASEYAKYDISTKKSLYEAYDKNTGLHLKKGEKVNHVTPLNFKNLKDGQDLFVSATDYDKNLYSSFLSLMLKKKGYGTKNPIKELEFELKNDLKAPSSKEQRNIFHNFYKKNKKQVDNDLKEYYESGRTRPSDTYEAFVKTMDNNKKSQSKTGFYKELRNNGYNAVLDQHDIDGTWIQAQQPLIVMDAKNVLGGMKIKELDDSSILNSLSKLYK